MIELLVFDLALVGLLVTSAVGRSSEGDVASRWFAASLVTGMLTFFAPWLAARYTSGFVDPVFALCNAAGFLVGPCLILHARALAARYSNGLNATGSPPASPPVRLWLPFGLALLVYAAAGLAGIEPSAFELWMAIGKTVSLGVSVTIAVTTMIRCRNLAQVRFSHHVDLWCTIVLVVIGLTTIPAALVGGEAMVQLVYTAVVLPALGVSLWLLTGLRLRGNRSSILVPATSPPSSASPATEGHRYRAQQAEILAPVFQAFKANLATDRSWQQAEFGLDDAARQLGIRRHLLSEAINLHASGGFSAVLNEYRIAAFRTALAEAPDEESVLAIGLRCGFGSKASLHRLVKDNCGLSPGALRSAIRESRRTS